MGGRVNIPFKRCCVDENLISCIVFDFEIHYVSKRHVAVRMGGYINIDIDIDIYMDDVCRWYAVHVNNLYLGSTLLPVDVSIMNSNTNRVIVDSGTTDSYFPSAYNSAWNAAFKEATGINYMTDSNGGCRGYTEEELAKMPPFRMTMASATSKSGKHLCFLRSWSFA
jgi:hypothetical protein